MDSGVAVTTQTTRDYRFAPSVGSWHVELVRLARQLDSADPVNVLEEIDQEIDSVLDLLSPESRRIPTVERIRYAFALSILHNILSAGGRVQVLDSEIYVAWPDWNSQHGRELTRLALSNLIEMKPLTEQDRRLLLSTSAPSLSTEQLYTVMAEGDFWLEPADARHPSGATYGNIFALALRTWSMPYRDRPGRNKRFVIVGRHPTLPMSPVVVGLIEVGDDAPYSTERNSLLCLRTEELLPWIYSVTARPEISSRIAERFANIRSALLPIDGLDLGATTASDIVNEQHALLTRAVGRSQSDKEFVEKKRLAYLVRLAHGEVAFSRIAHGEVLTENDASLREGVRAYRDLIVPRVHMEVSICGALPPFSWALAGKLVVSFLAHPAILGVTQNAQGSIVQKVFAIDSLRTALPDWGILGITTKGLYPSHSALYNRADVPASTGTLRMRRIGETRGATATLLGPRTARLAQHVQDVNDNKRQVSLVYGTGGAKRQRLIESAVISTGLPGSFIHAGIRRPVYGMRFASNIEEIIWCGAEPKWLVERYTSGESYSDAALALWRKRWLTKLGARLQKTDEVVPGLVNVLEGNGIQDDDVDSPAVS